MLGAAPEQTSGIGVLVGAGGNGVFVGAGGTGVLVGVGGTGVLVGVDGKGVGVRVTVGRMDWAWVMRWPRIFATEPPMSATTDAVSAIHMKKRTDSRYFTFSSFGPASPVYSTRVQQCCYQLRRHVPEVYAIHYSKKWDCCLAGKTRIVLWGKT